MALSQRWVCITLLKAKLLLVCVTCGCIWIFSPILNTLSCIISSCLSGLQRALGAGSLLSTPKVKWLQRSATVEPTDDPQLRSTSGNVIAVVESFLALQNEKKAVCDLGWFSDCYEPILCPPPLLFSSIIFLMFFSALLRLKRLPQILPQSLGSACTGSNIKQTTL